MNGSPQREFVDTNILIYAHDASTGAKHERARQLLLDLWEAERGALSLQVLQEFYVTVTRKVAKPLDPESASQIVAALSVWRVHTPGVKDLLSAIAVQRRYQLSFWDAMVIQSAAQLSCGTIWSEDLNPGQVYEGIRCRNPFVPT
jgi:predicted nucleic acid-binding protein